MSDVKLFRIIGNTVTELEGAAVRLERDLQALVEMHIEIFLHVRLVASEYSTGRTHAGRIDTLELDENNCPTIIEYKRNSKPSEALRLWIERTEAFGINVCRQGAIRCEEARSFCLTDEYPSYALVRPTSPRRCVVAECWS